MPVLGTLLTSIFSGIVTWLAQWFTKKVAFAGSVVVTYSVFTTALLVAMRATQVSLEAYVTGVPSNLLTMLGYMMPSATPFCVTALVTTWAATVVYAWQREALRMVAAA